MSSTRRETPVIRMDESNYSEVLNAMRSDTKLVSIDKMILEIQCNKIRKDTTYKCMAKDVIGEGVAEATLKVKIQDETTWKSSSWHFGNSGSCRCPLQPTSYGKGRQGTVGLSSAGLGTKRRFPKDRMPNRR